MAQKTKRDWITLWDRQNHRVLLLAGPTSGERWGFVWHDETSSRPGIYDIWRYEEDIVFVEVHLYKNDKPKGFPHNLLDEDLLGSMTIWPMPNGESFIWWHKLE